MTQTAVSEMFAQIKAARKDTQFWNDSMLVDWLLESEERFKQIEKEQIMQSIIEQAKEIHKQQSIDFLKWTEGTYSFGNVQGLWYEHINTKRQYTTEELHNKYYKEKYGKQ